MKYRYQFHPGDYELGENEKFYGDMEAKGWRLVKRGGRLSKFAPVEPSRARYRIEVFAPGFLEQSVLPEEQVAVFADCGWEYVTDRGLLHIFRAPAGSDAPEFYSDPAQQAETLKALRKNTLWGWSPALLWLVVYLGLNALMKGSAQVLGDLQRRFIQIPPLYFAVGFTILWQLYQHTRDAWIITRTYRRLKNGVPLDHNPRKRHVLHKLVNRTLAGLAAACLLLMAVQLAATRSTDPADRVNEPYLLLTDLGWRGEQGVSVLGDESSVTHTPSLLADYWDVREFLKTPAGRTVWMYQDVYRLRDAGMARALAEASMKTATFGDDGKNFQPLEAAGLDAAWTNGHLEVVAVKGPYVAYVSYLGASHDDFVPLPLCAALAERWAD